MEKLKLNDLQKYELLHRANHCIRSKSSFVDGDFSEGSYYPFISALSCLDVQFRCGAFSRKNGARVEIIYKYRNSRVLLLWHYVPVQDKELFYIDYEFILKAVTIEREFNSSLLISILPSSEDKHIYIYQSTKAISDLCVEDSVEGEGADVEQGSVCPAGVSGDTPLLNENKQSVTVQTHYVSTKTFL